MVFSMDIDKLHPRVSDVLLDYVQRAKKSVVLVSPFLSLPVAQQLAKVAKTSVAQWSLLITLDASAVAAGVLSTDGLQTLLLAGVEIRSIERLHAKVSIVDSKFGLVGSGNLTQAGLGSSIQPNLELSVSLNQKQIDDGSGIVNSWWQSADPVDMQAISRVVEQARQIPRIFPIPAGRNDNGTAIAREAVAKLLDDAKHRNLWVKGVYGDVEKTDWEGDGWIASPKKNRPSFFPGDLVIICALDEKACVAIVEVMTEPRIDRKLLRAEGWTTEEAERWPWVNDVRERQTAPRDRWVSPAELGFNGQGLQNGHRRIQLAEFVVAVNRFATPS